MPGNRGNNGNNGNRGNNRNNNGGGNGGGQGSNNNGNNNSSGLPAWLAGGTGGTGAPIPVSAWLSPDYPGGYAGWLNDHPNPGNSATPPENQVYAAWLRQQVGPDGQLHLPPAASVPNNGLPAAPSQAPAPAPAPVDNTTIEAPDSVKPTDNTKPPANTDGSPHEKPIPVSGPTTIPSDSIGGKSGGKTPDSNDNSATTPPKKTPGQISDGGTSAPTDVIKTAVTDGGGVVVESGSKLTASQRRGFSSSGSPKNGAVADAADGFPTTSSYPTSDDVTSDKQAAADLSGRGRKNGWGGMDDTAKDPAQVATYINTQQNTDPLNIKGDKTSS